MVRQFNNTCLSPVSRPKIKQLLENGTLVIVDRYAFSGVAFTAAKVGLYLLNFCLCLLARVLTVFILLVFTFRHLFETCM